MYKLFWPFVRHPPSGHGRAARVRDKSGEGGEFSRGDAECAEGWKYEPVTPDLLSFSAAPRLRVNPFLDRLGCPQSKYSAPPPALIEKKDLKNMLVLPIVVIEL